MTVSTIKSTLCDGYLLAGPASYAGARAMVGSTVFSNTSAQIGQFRLNGTSTNRCMQGFLQFDTSSIPDTDEIVSVVLRMYLLSDTSTAADFIIEVREHDWGDSLAAGDAVGGASLGGLTLLASLDTNGIGAIGEYKTFTSEAAFLTATNLKTGIVYVMLASSRQRLDQAPAANFAEEWVALINDLHADPDLYPELIVTHEAAGPIEGGSDLPISVLMEGEGFATRLGGSEMTPISVTMEGAGFATKLGGSEMSIALTMEGGGEGPPPPPPTLMSSEAGVYAKGAPVKAHRLGS